MVSYKNILTAMVLIFLYSQTTTTTLQQNYAWNNKIQNFRHCVREMVLICRTYKRDSERYGYLPSTLRCAQTAVKFWVKGMPLPDVVTKLYRRTLEMIDKSRTNLDAPEEYCERFYKEDQQKCIPALKDFGSDAEDALIVALYGKRLMNYLNLPPETSSGSEKTPMRNQNVDILNNYGLNYDSVVDSSAPFIRQMVGLDKVGPSETGTTSLNVFDPNANEPNEFAVQYMLHIANKIRLTAKGEAFKPYSLCLIECFDRSEYPRFNESWLIELFV